MENKIKVSYVTTLPKVGNAPRVSVIGDNDENYHVKFSESKNGTISLVSSGYCKNNETIISSARQWYTDWVVEVYDSKNNLVFVDVFDVNGKTVFIKMDAYALGDSIAWIPYVEEFRVKHNCNVICSTFHNNLFIDSYPKIMFVKPNTQIDNVYTQYYIGASNDGNLIYSKIKVNENPLQMVASETLGLPFKEVVPDLSNLCLGYKRRIKEKYVTLSEFGSAPNKHWKAENGWQSVVDYLNSKGFYVAVISKEKSDLKNVIDLTGDGSLVERAADIKHAEFHLGVSSGLSWLAWSLGTHVVMVSDVTPNWHEFNNKITRINSSDLSCVNYDNQAVTKVEEVIKKLEELVV
jgi:autotransporter strand-loop-strand O-heptosyltransferase